MKGDGKGTARIVRRGIPNGSEWSGTAEDTTRDLLFATYQSTIEDGYRFIQSAWANDPTFRSRICLDSMFNRSGHREFERFLHGAKPCPLNTANDFVKTIGGDCFFAPSMQLLRAGFNLNGANHLKH
jgi:deferrochelatase/peroxidase EfeB